MIRGEEIRQSSSMYKFVYRGEVIEEFIMEEVVPYSENPMETRLSYDYIINHYGEGDKRCTLVCRRIPNDDGEERHGFLMLQISRDHPFGEPVGFSSDDWSGGERFKVGEYELVPPKYVHKFIEEVPLVLTLNGEEYRIGGK